MRLDLLLTQLKLFASKINMNGKVRKEKVVLIHSFTNGIMVYGTFTAYLTIDVVMVNSKTEL